MVVGRGGPDILRITVEISMFRTIVDQSEDCMASIVIVVCKVLQVCTQSLKVGDYRYSDGG